MSCLDMLVIGFAVSEEDIDKIYKSDKYNQAQTHKLSWSLVRSLEANRCRVHVVSSAPIGLFPANSKMLWWGRRWKRTNGRIGRTTTFINILGLRHITRFLSASRLTLLWVLTVREGLPRAILVYGLCSAHMYCALLIGKLFRIPVVILTSDPPSSPLPGEGPAVLALREVDVWILRCGVQMADGLIGLTDAMSEWAPRLPFLRMEGIVSRDDIRPVERCLQVAGERCSSRPFVFLYAGGLEANYGVRVLMDAFCGLARGDCELWLAGKGSMIEEIERTAAADMRIRFRGFVSPSDVPEMLQHADCLVNARPSAQGFTPYSFPSKLLQFLSSGKPVLSTRLEGIPKEYWDYLLAIDDETPYGVRRALTEVLEQPRAELAERGRRARDFVLRSKSEMAQGRRIAEFVASVVAPPR